MRLERISTGVPSVSCHDWPGDRREPQRSEFSRARPEALARPGGVPDRRVHDAARRQHRQRRPARDAAGGRRVVGRAVLGRLGLRPDLRAGARRLGAPGRRPRPQEDVPARARAVHADERRGRARAERGDARRRPPAAGRGRRDAEPAGHRLHPAAVHRPRARAGVRAVRRRDRHLHRDRPAARRPAAAVGRRGRRLALGVLRQRPDRRRGPGPRRPPAPEGRARGDGTAAARPRRAPSCSVARSWRS